MTKALPIDPAEGKLGVLLVGLGAVSTTTIAGIMAVRKGIAKPIGSLTEMGTVRLGKRTEGRSPAIRDFVPLAGLDQLVFGGWDIFEDNCYEAAKTAGVLEAELLDQVKDELAAIKPMPAVFDRQYVKRLDGPNVKKGKNKRDLAEQLIADIRKFKADNRLDRLVLVWCGSTEIFLTEAPAHQSVAAFEKALEANDPAIPSSMIYAYAAIKEGIPYANAAPNLERDIPALLELAQKTGSPLAGKDMKTGQTLIKTIIAPGLKARLHRRRGLVLDEHPRQPRRRSARRSRVVQDEGREQEVASSTTSSSRISIRISTRNLPTSSASTTTRRAATTKRAGTTSTSSAGSAIRCSSRSISSAATASWRRRSCSTSRCSSIWRSAPAFGHPGVAVVLLQEPDARAGPVSGARSVHPADEAEEHAALHARRRTDHAPRARILRLTTTGPG